MTYLKSRRIRIVFACRVDLDLDTAEFGIGEPLAWVIRNEVLRAQFVADLAKRSVELVERAGVVILATSIARELDERVLAANVASGVALDGHDDDAIQDDLSLLRFADSVLIAGLADGVTAISDNDHDLAAAPIQ